jgi:hypothetical protein
MDASRFDALVRACSSSGSRRRALGVIVAGALAPLGAAAKPEPAKCLAVGKRCSEPAAEEAAHGRHKGEHKGKGKVKHHPPSCEKCCSRFGAAGADGKARCACKGEGVACANPSQCCSGDCRDGNCTACPPNTVFCPDGCANLQTDKNHCGGCDHACDVGQPCQDGQCVCDDQSCPDGCCDGATCVAVDQQSAQQCGTGGAACQGCGDDACCAGGCVDLQADPLNCGGCGIPCPVNEACVDGKCTCGERGSSEAPFTCCPGGAQVICSHAGGSDFTRADNCEVVTACPGGFITCVGMGPDFDCQACCPPGTSCDQKGGFCFQGGASPPAARQGTVSGSARRRKRGQR